MFCVIWIADVELVCLATWKIGSERYAFGYLTGPGFSVKNDAFRCLVRCANIRGDSTRTTTLSKTLKALLVFCF